MRRLTESRVFVSDAGRTVEIAGEVGFCFGVKRAIGLTRQALDREQPVYILGDLVHNRNVTDELERKGLKKVASVEGRAAGTMVIRAHGLPKAETDAAEAHGMTIVDATCPIVLRAQEAAQTLESRGCQVVILGDANHAEIKGVLGALQKPALVVESIEELRAAKSDRRLGRKVGVIFQTTHALELCRDVIGELVFMCKEVQIINTICRPVQDRQDDATQIAARSDLMLVVGSPTSANTVELAALCRSHNPWTVRVQSAEDVTDALVVWATRIGVASGLSTPVDVVESVCARVLACRLPVEPTRRPDPADTPQHR
jgi:4-hydroxy-3-methylbut-2-enyl diphosphate reductase